ncbi:MAG TPA: hypothetical protein VN905_09700 [Candidatus Binatia bacterium]|nr:hypothetical protein [Candidatus Binatia bacterium]
MFALGDARYNWTVMPTNELGPALAAAIIALIVVRNAYFLNPTPQRSRSNGKRIA